MDISPLRINGFGLEDLVVSEDAARVAVDRLCSESGYLISDIGFNEPLALDAVFLEFFDCFKECCFCLDATDDNVRIVFEVAVVKKCGLGNCVTGLNYLLPRRKVASNEDVNVRNLMGHVSSP